VCNFVASIACIHFTFVCNFNFSVLRSSVLYFCSSIVCVSYDVAVIWRDGCSVDSASGKEKSASPRMRRGDL